MNTKLLTILLILSVLLVTTNQIYAWTTCTTPAAPTLENPTNETPCESFENGVTLNWNDVECDDFYVYLSDIDATPDEDDVNANPSVSQWNTGTLEPNTTYYWRVKAQNGDDCIGGPKSAWSVVWNFTTAPCAPNAPDLVSPAHNSTCASVDGVTLDWNSVPDANDYGYCWGTTSPPTEQDRTENTFVSIGSLQPGTDYYWKIVPYSSCDDVGEHSEVRKFTTQPGQASNPDPNYAEIDVALDANLSWTPGAGAADVNGHDVYFGTDFADVNTGDAGVHKGLEDSNSYNPGGMDSNTTYYWRIDEVDDYDCARTGTVWQFTTCILPEKAADPDVKGPTGEPNAIDSILHWVPGNPAESHDVYFGTDFNDVNDANTLSDEFMGNRAVDVNHFDTRKIHAFLYKDLTITKLDSLGQLNEPNHIETWSEAFGISESGDIVGFSYDPDGNPHAFIWEPNGATGYDLTDLHTLGDANESAAYDISDANWIVGRVDANAFLMKYPDDMNMIQPPSLFSETDNNSVARAVSNGTDELDTVAVGWSGGHAVYWDNLDTSEPNVHDLGTVSSYCKSRAYNINEYRQVVGYYRPMFENNPNDRAFVGDLDNGLTDIGTLEQGNVSRAYGINNAGQVVGEATIDSNDDQLRAFIYDGCRMYNLNDLIRSDANDANVPNWVIISTQSINDDGCIAGYGRVGDSNDPNSNYDRALLLIPARPIAHWQFDQTSGTTAMDVSVKGNHGQVQGATWVTGKIRGALSFDGDGDRVDISDDDVFSFGDGSNDNPFTIAAWVKPNDITGTIRAIISKRGFFGDREWSFYLDADGKPVLWLYDEDVNKYEQQTADVALADTNWHFILATYDGRGGVGAVDGITIYVDALPVASGRTTSGTYVSMVNTGGKVVIGNIIGGVGTFDFNGTIDDVRIYPYALSQAEITELFEGASQY